jgi:hypothetical protein
MTCAIDQELVGGACLDPTTTTEEATTTTTTTPKTTTIYGSCFTGMNKPTMEKGKTCPEGDKWKRFDNPKISYGVFEKRLNVSNLRNFCESKKARIPFIERREQNVFLNKFFRDRLKFFPAAIKEGLNLRAQGYYLHMSVSKLKECEDGGIDIYKNFAPGEPNQRHGNSEDSIEVWPFETNESGGLWNDSQGKLERFVVCECVEE